MGTQVETVLGLVWLGQCAAHVGIQVETKACLIWLGQSLCHSKYGGGCAHVGFQVETISALVCSVIMLL
jgi:hypothetical protein